MLPEFHTDSGLMGAPTHYLSVGDLQADRSPAGLQEFLLEQPCPDQVHLGTRIHQHIHHPHFLSVYFFSISAFLKCSKVKSNTNRPDLTISGRAVQSHQQNSITIDYLQAFITNESIHICFIVHGYRQPALVNYTINNTSIAAPNMSFLFGGNKVAQPAQFEISTNLRLEQPSTSKLAAFVAASEQKVVQNDFHFYVLNENKSKAFNRKKVSLPAAARQQLYDLSPWSVGLDEDDLHISFNDIQVPLQQPCVRATGYCRAMAQCALQNYSAQHSARYGSGSWVCNPMS